MRANYSTGLPYSALLEIVVELVDGSGSRCTAMLHATGQSTVNAINPSIVEQLGAKIVKLEEGDPAISDHNMDIDGKPVNFIGSVELHWWPFDAEPGQKKYATPTTATFYVPEGPDAPFDVVLAEAASEEAGLRGQVFHDAETGL